MLGFVMFHLHLPASAFWQMTPIEYNSAYDQFLGSTFSDEDLGKMGIVRVENGIELELTNKKIATPWGDPELVAAAKKLVEESNV